MRAAALATLIASTLVVGAAVGGDVSVYAPPPEVRAAPPSVPAVTGPRFRQTLDAPVAGVSWKGVPLRDILRQLADGYGVATLRDRRVDPTVAPEVAAAGVPLSEVLAQVAGGVGAEVRFVGHVAYVGPPEATAVVRTLAELRRREVEAVQDRSLSARRAALLRGQTVRWGDLTPASEALRLVTDRFGLVVENPDVLPHDLWGGAVLPELAAAEALTLVLIQFDLTFAWGESLDRVRLVPLPADRRTIAVERVFQSRSREAEAAAQAGDVPGLTARSDGDRVTVRGTVEGFEELEKVIPVGRPPRKPRDAPDVVPLARRKFTLTVSRVPARAVMAKIEETGVEFEYDPKALEAAGVDLNAPVAIDVREATAERFLAALFDPLGLTAEVDGVTVRLRPRE